MYEEGLFCSDPSIALPYRPSRFPAVWIGIYSATAPLAVIFVAELMTSRRKMWRMLCDMLGNYLIVMVGSVAKYGITLMAKATWGKLRPHFLDVCKPQWEHVNCTNRGFPRFVIYVFLHK